MSKVCLFQTLELSKATTFVKRGLWVYFHQVGGLQNEQSFAFSSFSSIRAFKSLHLCQKSSLSIIIFTKRAAHKMSKVCLFRVFQVWELSRASTFVKRGLWVYFHQAGGLQNEQSLLFSSFSSFRTFKSLHFCQRGLWVHFHQADGLQNEKSLPFQAYQSIATIWSKNVLK